MSRYAVVLSHDKGFVRLKVAANSLDHAVQIATAAEGAPFSAVIRVEVLEEKRIGSGFSQVLMT